MPPRIVHLISYGDQKFQQSKKRLLKQALATGWFDSVTLYGPEDLSPDFRSRFADILAYPKGGGYWIWKAHLIQKKLATLQPDDILIYIDAGCTINPYGKERFQKYLKMLSKISTPVLSFQLPHIEREYTTSQTFKHFNISPDSQLATSGQILGGIRIMKKTPLLERMIAIELETYQQNPLLVTDSYNTTNQEDYFRDHRHEQSIFSLIRKLHNPFLLKDETFFTHKRNFGSQESLKYPFWATRVTDLKLQKNPSL